MCGRYTLWHSPQDLRDRFKLGALPDVPPSYNIAPGQQVPIIRESASGNREMVMVRWGLVPFWAKDPGSLKGSMINARAETAAEKPAYREAFRRRRCLVPTSGFYEWKRTSGAKQPYFVRFKDDQPFALAGLWEHWEGDGEALESCTILTTDPNALMKTIHDRMPVIVAPENFDVWLDPDLSDTGQLEPLLAPYPDEVLEAYPVRREVGNPRYNSPDNIGRMA